MNFSRTKLLDKWCDEMTKVAEARSKQILTENFDHTFEIDDESVNVSPIINNQEKKECRRLLYNYYNSFLKRLQEERNWTSVFCLLQDYSQFVRDYLEEKNIEWSFTLHPTNLLNKAQKEDVSIVVGIEIKDFFRSITNLNYFECILTESTDWCWDDLIALNDDDVIKKIEGSIQWKTPLDKIRYLSNVKSELKDYEKRNGYLNCFLFDKLHLTERHHGKIPDAIHRLILMATPALELKSKQQVKILKDIVIKIKDHTLSPHPLDDRFDYLMAYGKVNVKHEGGAKSDLKFILKKKAKPAAIIRELLSQITTFNSYYQSANLDMKLWLHCMFYGERGFSLNHILNVR